MNKSIILCVTMLILLQSILSFLVKAKLPRCVKEGRKTDGKVTTPPPNFSFISSSKPSSSLCSTFLSPLHPPLLLLCTSPLLLLGNTLCLLSTQQFHFQDRQREREGGGGREGEIENTLLLKDKDLSTERLVYISVPDDTHISITDTQ